VNILADKTKRDKSQPSISNPDTAQILKRLEMLDQRLDNMDSVVSAVVERVMKQPLAFTASCPKCGQNIEIGLIGTHKPTV